MPETKLPTIPNVPKSTSEKDYEPTDVEKKQAAEISQKYTAWREDKRPHEVGWYITAAFVRGLQWIVWNEALNKLEVKDQPSHRMRITVNRMLSKYKARQAKFLKNRPMPIIVPASTDREDKLNAEATQKALEYTLRRERVEEKYRQALGWAQTCGKGFWWLYWDKELKGQVRNDKTGKTVDAVLGDARIDVGSPFEVLVKDPGIQFIGQQPEIIRAKSVLVADLIQTYSNARGLKGDATVAEVFHYQTQIANLSSSGVGGMLVGASRSQSTEPTPLYITRIEWFQAPTAKFPKGRYTVVAGDRVLRHQDFLPYKFYEDPNNPYPCVEFADTDMPGQFWPPTIIEQLIGLQKEYNLMRSKVAEQIKMMAFPKVIVAVQCQWPKNAWTTEPGEVIRIVLPPGVPEPHIIHPPNISQDVWNVMNIIRQEFDDVPNIYPSSTGSAGQATSGFQTNLLQEAADSVHAPDIRSHEIAFEVACYKLRRMMQQGYDVRRLISIVGRANVPEVMEFSQDQIDEHADIIVHTGSALSSSPAVKTQQVIELWNAGILGDTKSSETQRRALTMIDAGGMGELQEERRRDEDKARLENLRIGRGEFVQPPLPFDDHEVHWTFHTDQMKSSEFENWKDAEQKELFAHTLIHGKWTDPGKAVMLAIELGMPPEFIQFLQPVQPPPPPSPEQPPIGPPTAGPETVPPPPMSPPPGPPPGPPPPPEAPFVGGPPGMPPPEMVPPPGMPPPSMQQAMQSVRRITRIIRDPQTNLIMGAETTDE